MSVWVYRPEGIKAFNDADDFKAVGQLLTVYTNDKAIAMFHPGEWSYATREMEE